MSGVAALLLTALTCISQTPAPAAPAGPAGAEVLVWRRAGGPAAKDSKGEVARVSLASLPTTERTLKDVRGAALTVRGLPLDALLRKAPAAAVPGLEDTAVLRFKNGTRVALPLRDVARFDVFVALAVKLSDQGEWVSTFEPVPLGTPHWRAARALEFAGNRVLAGNPSPPRGASTFNPWGFVDSLVEIELVNAAAWRKVFAVGATDVEDKGLTVFENRCATCHGARGAGARLGWDFVEPLSVTTWRTPASLFEHVRAHKLDAAEVGLLMPPQPDVTQEETGALHAWMTKVSQSKLNDYKP